ncbi:RNA polymerase sigma factor [Ulvibacterium sp.]|uniref:RNA polymerase sigma factor n=1 Tax=Ulvibacterium sp. TaxID=2665914 RepID=UPI00260F1AA0|nr:RNA polymerase sigma factor [Ulvibacterium sp.]
MKEQTDEIIMGMVAQGDLDLLKILFKRHHLHVYNFLYKMCRDKMLSEDVTQEVFYNIMRYRASYKNGKFVSWMFTIARNCLKKHLKKNVLHHDDLDDVSYRLLDNEVPKEDYTHLQKALDKLNPSDKELLVLNRFQEIKYAELAQIVGSTEGAVKTKVSRALKKLKTIYFENL